MKNQNKISPWILFFAYLQHIENKPSGYICELKDCPELVKVVEQLSQEKNDTNK